MNRERKKYRTYRFRLRTDLGDGVVVPVTVTVDRYGVTVRKWRGRTRYALGLNRVARLVAVEDQKDRVRRAHSGAVEEE
jgi:hypothetical protein